MVYSCNDRMVVVKAPVGEVPTLEAIDPVESVLPHPSRKWVSATMLKYPARKAGDGVRTGLRNKFYLPGRPRGRLLKVHMLLIHVNSINSLIKDAIIPIVKGDGKP